MLSLGQIPPPILNEVAKIKCNIKQKNWHKYETEALSTFRKNYMTKEGNTNMWKRRKKQEILCHEEHDIF